MDGIAKSGPETAVEWAWRVYIEAEKKFQVPDCWTKALIFLLYEAKVSKRDIKICRGMSLSIVSKVYRRIVIDCGLMISEPLAGEEDGGFRKGGGYENQLFALRQVVKML